jgi:hypothetical protein
MIPAEAQAVILKSLLPAEEYSDPISGAYTSVLAEGIIMMIEDVGGFSTGSFSGGLYTATTPAGAGATVMTQTDGTTTSEAFTTSGHLHKKLYDARQCKGFLGYLGSVTTGPISMSVSVLYRPKTST